MRLVSPKLIVVGSIALAGCGSSSSAEPSTSAFTHAFKVQKAQLRILGKAVGTAVTGAAHKSDAELTKEFKNLATRATALAGQLGQLEAPTKYKAELAGLQSSLTQVAGTLHSIEAAAAAHDANAAKAGGEAIVTEAEQVKSDDDALSAKLGLKGTS